MGLDLFGTPLSVVPEPRLPQPQDFGTLGAVGAFGAAEWAGGSVPLAGALGWLWGVSVSLLSLNHCPHPRCTTLRSSPCSWQPLGQQRCGCRPGTAATSPPGASGPRCAGKETPTGAAAPAPRTTRRILMQTEV